MEIVCLYVSTFHFVEMLCIYGSLFMKIAWKLYKWIYISSYHCVEIVCMLACCSHFIEILCLYEYIKPQIFGFLKIFLIYFRIVSYIDVILLHLLLY